MNHQWRCSLPSPQRHTHAVDIADRTNRTLDLREQDALLGGEIFGEVCRPGEVLPRLEDQDERQPC